MPLRHGPDCRCPPLPADAGLLGYTVSCEHREQLAKLLGEIAPRPDTSSLAILPAVEKRLEERSELARAQHSALRKALPEPRQPWEPRPPRRRAA